MVRSLAYRTFQLSRVLLGGEEADDDARQERDVGSLACREVLDPPHPAVRDGERQREQRSEEDAHGRREGVRQHLSLSVHATGQRPVGKL